MKKVFIVIFFNILILASLIYLKEGLAKAETTTETFLNSIVTDLPPSDVTCRGLGILQELILRTPIFKSEGNSFFLDKKNREIAVFERAEVINVNDNNKKIAADLYVRVPDVQRGDLVDLLLQKRLVATRNAQAIFVIKVTVGSVTETYVYTGKDENGNPITSGIITRIRKLGNITHKGTKFVTVTGKTKIRFPVPPKKVGSNGSLIDVFDKDASSGIVCKFKRTPVHDFDLTDIKDAFDEKLANDIINEASLDAGEDEEPDGDDI